MTSIVWKVYAIAGIIQNTCCHSFSDAICRDTRGERHTALPFFEVCLQLGIC